MNTLAFGYILPTTGWIRDFNPLETCAARRTRKETAALKIKAAVSNRRVKLSALRRLFSFAVVRQSIIQYLIQCFQ